MFKSINKNCSKQTFLRNFELEAVPKLRSPLKPLFFAGQIENVNIKQEINNTDDENGLATNPGKMREMTERVNTQGIKLQSSSLRHETKSFSQKSEHGNKQPQRSFENIGQECKQPHKPRSSRTQKFWEDFEAYPTFDDALQEIKKESCWSIKSSTDTVVAFRCNRVRSQKKQCDSGKRIIRKEDKSVVIQISKNPHSCDNLEKSANTTKETKDFIEALYRKGLKQKAIESELIKAKINPLPSCHVIRKIIHNFRKHRGNIP